MDIKIESCIRICSFICAVIIMIIIFVLSSHNSQVSTEDSENVAKVIHKVTQNIVSDNSLHQNQHQKQNKEFKVSRQFNSYVRKIGHILEYTALSFFLFFAIFVAKRGLFKTSFFVFIISLLYAITDEIHQYFVPGRGCEFIDIVKDSIGMIIGCLLSGLVLIIIKKTNMLQKFNGKEN